MRKVLLLIGFIVPVVSSVSASLLQRLNHGMGRDELHPHDAGAPYKNQRELTRRHLTFRSFDATKNKDPTKDEWSAVVDSVVEDPLEDEGISFSWDKGSDTSRDDGKRSKTTYEDEDPLEDEGIPFFSFEKDSTSEDGTSHPTKDSVVVEEAQDENESCSICGSGYEVTKPDANGINPMDLSVTCEQLERVAEQGVFTKQQCQMLVDMNFDTCGCESTHVAPESTIATTESKEDPQKVPCSICGQGYGITNMDANGIVPEDKSITCGQIQEMAEDGKFTADECEELMKDADIFRTCECQADPHFFHDKGSDSSDETHDNDPPDDTTPVSKTVICSICGKGFAVTNIDAGIDPDVTSLTCGDVQEAAESGKFTADECDELINDFRIFSSCGCETDPLDEIRDRDPPDKDKPSFKPLSCSICGKGFAVTQPDVDGIDPDEPSLTCGKLQEAAEDGKFTADECDELMSNFRLFSSCGCEKDPFEEASHSYDPPVKDLPFSNNVVCSICGKGFAVTNSDANGIDPDEPSLTCGELQLAAEDGKFTADECDELANNFRLFTACECKQDPFYSEDDPPDEIGDSGPPLVSCSICGSGYAVFAPDVNGIDPDQPSLTCGKLQEAAEDGKFTAEECDELANDFRLFTTCGCEVDPLDETLDTDPPPEEDVPRSKPASCDICGEGYVVSKTDEVGIIPEDPSRSCGQVQRAAENGEISADECDALMKDFRLFTTCGCIMDPLDDLPTDNDPPPSKTVVCSICGPGYVVSDPDAYGFDPDDPSLTCGDVQDAAVDGKFTADECVELKNDVRLFNTCGCEPDVFGQIQEKEGNSEDSSGDRSPCSVCGAGYMVTMANVDGIYYGGSSRTCGQVQEAAEDGKFTSEECLDLMNSNDIFVACGCAPDPAQSRTESRPTSSSNGGVDIPSFDSSEEESSVSGGGGGGGDCELSVTVKCVPPKDSGHDSEESCAEYFIPESNEPVSTPLELDFQFQGGLCHTDSDAPQGANKYLCQDFNGGATVVLEDSNYIEAFPPREMGALYYYQGNVQIGGTLNFTNHDTGAPLDEEILILVYSDSTKTELLQMIVFQTNTKTDLTLGDMYGSLQLLSFSNSDSVSDANLNLTVDQKKNITVQVTITNLGSEDVHVDHAVTFVEQSSREVVGNGGENDDIVLRASGQEGVTLVQKFIVDSILQARIISLSATVSGHDSHMNTCVAFGETSIVIPEYGHNNDHGDPPPDENS